MSFIYLSNVACLKVDCSILFLSGYEDARKKSSDSSCLAETNKINMSIYALLNVFHALSTNENRVPYRESKLTRMLQDSLKGTSRILMVICMVIMMIIFFSLFLFKFLI